MKFYQDSTTKLWNVGNHILPAASCELIINENDLIDVVKLESGEILAKEYKYSDFKDESDNAYSSMDAFITATKNFFFQVTDLRDLRTNAISVVSDNDQSDSIEITPEKAVELKGDSTVWDDLTSDITRAKTIGTRVTFNDAENTMEFSATATLTDYIVLSYQMSHKWKIGSKVYPHIHWEQALNATPNWMIQYRWQKQGKPKTTAWTNYVMTTNAFSYSSGTLNQISHDSGITPPVDAGLSDIIEIRLIRDSANATGLFPGANQYAGTVGVTSLDIHYEIDTLGSKDEYIK